MTKAYEQSVSTIHTGSSPDYGSSGLSADEVTLLIDKIYGDHPSQIFSYGLRDGTTFYSGYDIVKERNGFSKLSEAFREISMTTTDGMLVHRENGIKLVHNAHRLLLDYRDIQMDHSVDGLLDVPEKVFDEVDGTYMSYDEFKDHWSIEFGKRKELVKNPIYQWIVGSQETLDSYIGLMEGWLGRHVDFKKRLCIVLPKRKYELTLGFIVLESFGAGHNINVTNSALSKPIGFKDGEFSIPER